jgi:hypothetical protein
LEGAMHSCEFGAAAIAENAPPASQAASAKISFAGKMNRAERTLAVSVVIIIGAASCMPAYRQCAP